MSETEQPKLEQVEPNKKESKLDQSTLDWIKDFDSTTKTTKTTKATETEEIDNSKVEDKLEIPPKIYSNIYDLPILTPENIDSRILYSRSLHQHNHSPTGDCLFTPEVKEFRDYMENILNTLQKSSLHQEELQSLKHVITVMQNRRLALDASFTHGFFQCLFLLHPNVIPFHDVSDVKPVIDTVFDLIAKVLGFDAETSKISETSTNLVKTDENEEKENNKNDEENPTSEG